MGYVFSDEWHRERERLAGVEAVADPTTTALLRDLGVGPGWRCAEVGAGSGSIAAWLCEQADDVVATDRDVRFLDALSAPNLTVLRHDLTVDDVPGEPFDLVHARLVVEHVGDREGALERLAGWLRPGGWLAVEDVDWSGCAAVTESPEFDATLAAALQVASASAGYDPAFGRRLPALFLGLGLADVRGQLRSFLARGGTQEIEALRLTLERLAPAIVTAGLVTEGQAGTALARCADPTFVVTTPTMVSVAGRLGR